MNFLEFSLLVGVGGAAAGFLGAAADYIKNGFTNFRIGMFLESATTIGALLGAYIAVLVSTSAIAVLFGTVLLCSAYLSIATPLASVAFSLAAFALQRDIPFVAVTLVVLFVVLFGLTREGADASAPAEKFRLVCTASDTSLRFPHMMEVPEQNAK